MHRKLFITTSWDDGHPMDLRVGELLAKYGLKATFYVPRTSQRRTMSPVEVRELGKAFEIGGHTLHHVELTSVDDVAAKEEIYGSRSWIENSIDAPCRMFCFPRGRYRRRHLELVTEAGFLGARTTELLSLGHPRLEGRLWLMPVTVQAYPLPLQAYLKNAVRRATYTSLLPLIARARSTDWMHLAATLAAIGQRRGGVFHLTGHSWEIDENGLWAKLEEILSHLSQLASDVSLPDYCTNGDLCPAEPSEQG